MNWNTLNGSGDEMLHVMHPFKVDRSLFGSGAGIRYN